MVASAVAYPRRVIRLSRERARQIAVRAQLLDRRSSDLLPVVERLTHLQVDPTNAVAPSVDLVLWSRMGDAYWPGAADDALADRMLFQLIGTLRPMSHLPLYLAEMASWPPDPGRGQRWLEDNDTFRRGVLDLLEREGPLLSREIPDTATVPWESSGWTGNRSVTMMLELLNVRGRVAIVGREGRERLWDLASRVYPAVPPVPLDESRRERRRLRVRSLGISRPRIPAYAAGDPWYVEPLGEPATVAGVDGEWVVDPEALDEPFVGRTALLSPFDRLVHDRERLADLFEFDYLLEMFKPAAKRRWGYFALPVLHDDRFVGKVDAKADRRAGVLRVNAIHADVPFGGELTDAVNHELEALAAWLHLTLR
jgi:hypothetical protein